MSRTFVSPDRLPGVALLGAWVSALLPWSVVYSPINESIAELLLRFPLLEVIHVVGADSPLEVHTTLDIWRSILRFGMPGWRGYALWTVGGVLLALAFLVSTALFVREEAVRDATPVPVPRAIGALLLASAGLLVAAAALIAVAGYAGPPVPVGLVAMVCFGLVLLVNPLEDR